MKVLIVRSSHKNSNKKETNSVFHHFCPGLPVSLALCHSVLLSSAVHYPRRFLSMSSRRLHSMQYGSGRIPVRWRCVPKQSCPTHSIKLKLNSVASARERTSINKQIALQWIPGNCQIAGNEHADALAKKGAKITQTYIRETSYHSIKLHLKQVFQSVYRHELET